MYTWWEVVLKERGVPYLIHLHEVTAPFEEMDHREISALLARGRAPGSEYDRKAQPLLPMTKVTRGMVSTGEAARQRPEGRGCGDSVASFFPGRRTCPREESLTSHRCGLGA